MADEATTLRLSNPVNSDIDLGQTSSYHSHDLSSHDATERSTLHDGEYLDPDIRNRLWTPFFLRRYTLLAFIAFYLSIAAGLVALLVIDEKKEGLASARTSQHYLWTYGPTAILTLAATLWGQVEHRAKQVMPWAVLRTGPTKASETLFIDYVSINQISAFFKSFRARHFPVTVAVLGSVLIKLLIVISTSILVLKKQPWAIENVSVSSTEVFSSRDWNSTYDHITPVSYTIAMSLFNISYRSGTSKEQAVPNLDFQNLNLGDSDVIEVDLPTFQTDISCETARVTSTNVFDAGGETHRKFIYIDFETSSSTFSHEFSRLGFYEKWMDASADFHLMQEHRLDGNKYALFSGYLRPNTSEFHPYNTEANQHSDTNESSIMTILVCEIAYGITSLSLEMDTRQMLLSNPPSIPLSTSREQLANLSDQEFSGVLEESIEEMKIWLPLLEMDEVGLEGVYTDRMADDDIDPTFFTLLILGKSTAAQMAKAELLVAGSELYNATIHTTEQRLHVRNISIYLAFGILAALTITTGALCILAPQNTSSRDIGSIGGFSTILSRSVDLSTYLYGSGCSHLDAIQDSMSLKWCKSHAEYANGNANFGVDLYGDENLGELLQRQEDSSNKIKWWRPFAISAIHKALVLILVISIIVTLEILHHASHNNNGLVEINNEATIRYMWLYVPVLLMMAVQILVGMIGSTSNIILPYHELRNWPSNGERTLLDKQPSLLTVHALCNSIHQRHWSIIATSLSMLLSPFLTIAAAGLYTAESVPGSETLPLRIHDTLLSTETREHWIHYGTNDTTLSNTAFISSLLMRDENMVYPPWTLHGLVFPEISSLETENSSHKDATMSIEDQSSVTVRLSALRPSLNCSLMSEDEFNITFNLDESEMDLVQLYQLKWGEVIFTMKQNVQIDAQYPGGCAIGDGTETIDGLQLWPMGNNVDRGFGSARDIQIFTGMPFCPSLMMVYGWNNDTSGFNVAMCDGFIEEVQVDTTLSLPSFDILDAQIDEDTAHRVEDGSASLGLLLRVAGLSGTNIWRDEEAWQFDSFFTLILRGLEADSLEWNDILGKKGFPKFVDRIRYYWRAVFPQYLNLRCRTKIEGDHPVINGTVNRSDQFRFQQSDISTRILEVLLGIITACVGISFWAMNTKEILPKNPCSIAAQASLLAGSSMLTEDVIPPGSEWLSDKKLLQKGVFDGLLFSMGWRGGAGGEKRWFGIDVGKSDWSR